MAIVDWVRALSGYSQDQISAACDMHIRDGKAGRPKPGDILSRIGARQTQGGGRGDKSKVSRDEMVLLESKILPTARRWLSIPGLADQGRQTLEYWGEMT